MKINYIALLILHIAIADFAFAQTSPVKTSFKKESLPPQISGLYEWWNLLHYTIEIIPDYNKKYISGTNSVKFEALQAGHAIQIDLQDPMRITAVKWHDSPIEFKKENDKYIIDFPRYIRKGEVQTIIITFEGHPQTAINPPFDSGWIWKTDKQGRPWMSIACEGSGASIWLPCKDVLYDEPDNGISFSISVPDTLVAVANGRLIKKKSNKAGSNLYTWNVVSPINNYNIIPYVGKYINWRESYSGINGKLDCDYWVLDYNIDKAKKHLRQVDTMLHSFEYWFGAYPFYKDGYKLVEAPMPGMEHQSAIAYGNEFENGYSGRDLSGTGWGLKWDFILIHESAHEWFGNSITSSNHNDTWIHEGFAKYAECLYTSYVFGTKAGDEYAIGLRKRIKNDKPVIGSGSSDKYYKGSVLLHTVRLIIGDSEFRLWLQKLNKTFYHHTVNTGQIIGLLNLHTEKNFAKIFEQYLTSTDVPELEYIFQNNALEYRWSNCVDSFDMPIKISFDQKNYSFIRPTTKWQKVSLPDPYVNTLTVDNNFYVTAKELKQRKN